MARSDLSSAARRIAETLPTPVPRLRVFERVGAAACLVTVWNAAEPMPTAARRKPPAPPRGELRAAILAAVGAAGRLTTKELVRELRSAGLADGASTITKTLASLTKAGELLNPRDSRGYRLPE